MRALLFRYRKIVLIVLLGVLCLPLFFNTYRQTAFHSIPYDEDYADYLLHMVKAEGGKVPPIPFKMRALSVIPAIPFYYGLPLYRFSNLPAIPNQRLKALAALAMVSYLAIIASAVMLYKITVRRLGGPPLAGAAAALGSILFFAYTAAYCVDPLAILMICLIIYNLDSKKLFALLTLTGTAVNEKVGLVILFLMLGRLLNKRKAEHIYTLLPAGALGIYFAVLFAVKDTAAAIPGGTGMLRALFSNLALTFSFKGLIINLVPVLLIVVLYKAALAENKAWKRQTSCFTPWDWIPAAALFLIACALNVRFNIGRIVMYTFPLYLPLAMLNLRRILSAHGAHSGQQSTEEKFPFYMATGDTIEGKEFDLVLIECSPAFPDKGYVPSYGFLMTAHASTEKIGHVNFRCASNEVIDQYAGHIGYGVEESYRGKSFAAKACRMLIPLLKRHAISPLIITCNPDNLPSKKTIENLGCLYLDTVDVPPDLQPRFGGAQKMRYEWKMQESE